MDSYMAATGEKFSTPAPLDNFVSYGKWFQQQLVPNVQAIRVTDVSPADSGFRLQLADGGHFSASAVVVATGIAPFAWRPPEFAGLPAELASHASEHIDFAGFRGKK